MASKVYEKALEKFLTGGINWNADTTKAVLVTSAYTPNFSSHEFLSTITAAMQVATSPALTGKTSLLGVANAANTVLAAVPAGKVGAALVVYKDTGSAATSPLICYVDNVISGLPVTPNGGDINIIWDPGADKVFRLLS